MYNNTIWENKQGLLQQNLLPQNLLQQKSEIRLKKQFGNIIIIGIKIKENSIRHFLCQKSFNIFCSYPFSQAISKTLLPFPYSPNLFLRRLDIYYMFSFKTSGFIYGNVIVVDFFIHLNIK